MRSYNLKALSRRYLIRALERALERLRGTEKSEQYSEDPHPNSPPAPPAPESVTAPVRPVTSHVIVPSSAENPRPLRGREKYREQKHLASCCAHQPCALNSPDTCPVLLGLEPPYFPCAH